LPDLFRLIRFEGEPFTGSAHIQRVTLLDVPSQELLGQRIQEGNAF
jgi:hypothetical protein